MDNIIMEELELDFKELERFYWESYTDKYQRIFNNCIKDRYKAMCRFDIDAYIKYNAQSGMLIGIIEDFRKLEGLK